MRPTPCPSSSTRRATVTRGRATLIPLTSMADRLPPDIHGAATMYGYQEFMPGPTVGAAARPPAASPHRCPGSTFPSATSRRSRWSLAVVGVLLVYSVAGCAESARVSSQTPPSAAATVGEARNHVDVLFARDAIAHGNQAVALSNLMIGRDDVDPRVVAVARQIAASSTSRTKELQALLLSWGFPPMTPSPFPPAATPSAPVQPGEHPLASEDDARILRDAVGARATEVFLDLMIRQHQFAIAAAREQLQSGMHRGAMSVARSLIEGLQVETSVLESLMR